MRKKCWGLQICRSSPLDLLAGVPGLRRLLFQSEIGYHDMADCDDEEETFVADCENGNVEFFFQMFMCRRTRRKKYDRKIRVRTEGESRYGGWVRCSSEAYHYCSLRCMLHPFSRQTKQQSSWVIALAVTGLDYWVPTRTCCPETTVHTL